MKFVYVSYTLQSVQGKLKSFLNGILGMKKQLFIFNMPIISKRRVGRSETETHHFSTTILLSYFTNNFDSTQQKYSGDYLLFFQVINLI
jgi:hypothetical protein